MFIIGVYIVLPATTVSGDQAASINIGANYYYRITFNILKAGRISGTFRKQVETLSPFTYSTNSSRLLTSLARLPITCSARQEAPAASPPRFSHPATTTWS